LNYVGKLVLYQLSYARNDLSINELRHRVMYPPLS
jgi:hypothetical protein